MSRLHADSSQWGVFKHISFCLFLKWLMVGSAVYFELQFCRICKHLVGSILPSIHLTFPVSGCHINPQQNIPTHMLNSWQIKKLDNFVLQTLNLLTLISEMILAYPDVVLHTSNIDVVKRSQARFSLCINPASQSSLQVPSRHFFFSRK